MSAVLLNLIRVQTGSSTHCAKDPDLCHEARPGLAVSTVLWLVARDGSQELTT
jgi:hypothetical protein